MSDVTPMHPEVPAGMPATRFTTAHAVRTVRDPGLPAAQGLYDPKNEKDSCGVGFVADMKNRKSHAIVEQGLSILKNLDHRGAVGADPKMGDGCGILVQIPHGFFAAECAANEIELPPSRGIRRRPPLHAARSGGTCARRGHRRQGDRRRGPASPGMARSAGQFLRPRREREEDRAAAPADLHRQGQGDGGPGDVRAASLPRPQGDFERRLQHEGPAHGGLLPGLPVLAHDRLQGDGARHAAGCLLSRPAGPALRERHRARPPALRDQHLPDMAARPSLPDGGP